MIERVEAAIQNYEKVNGELPRRLQMTAMQYLELDKDLKLRERIPDSQVRDLRYRGIPIWLNEEREESDVNG